MSAASPTESNTLLVQSMCPNCDSWKKFSFLRILLLYSVTYSQPLIIKPNSTATTTKKKLVNYTGGIITAVNEKLGVLIDYKILCGRQFSSVR